MLVGHAGVGAAAGLAKLLLELAVVLVVIGVVVGLDVDVGALVVGAGSVEEAPEVLRQVGRVVGTLGAGPLLVVVRVVVVCHRWPFSLCRPRRQCLT